MITSESGNNILTQIEMDAVLSHLSVIRFSARTTADIEALDIKIEAGKTYSNAQIAGIISRIDSASLWEGAISRDALRAANAIRQIFGAPRK